MITELSIKNFKALREADLKLSNITLLTGLNAVGKSTVIQSLLLLRQSFINKGFPKGLVLNSDEYINLGIGKDVISISSEKTAVLDIELRWDYRDELRFKYLQSPESDVLSSGEIKNSQNLELEKFALFNKNFQYLCANRITPKVKHLTSPYYVDDALSLGKEGEYTVHYLAINKDRPIPIQKLKHPRAKSDNLLDNINAWLSEISPGVRVNPTYHAELETASLGFNFEIESGYTENFKPTNVGFGLSYCLPIITAILIAKPNGLIIIENPESHLHPAGQSKIAQLCALAGANQIQIIMETHSDHVLNGLRVAVKSKTINPLDLSIYYFDREVNSPNHETEITNIQIDENGKVDEWPKGFFDEWDNQLDKLLE